MSESIPNTPNTLGDAVQTWVAHAKLKDTCLADIAHMAREGDSDAFDLLAKQAGDEVSEETTIPCVRGMGKCGIRLILEDSQIQPVECPEHSEVF